MSRLEFSRSTRRDALKRSGMLCEATSPRYGLDEDKRCNAPLGYGVEFDHDVPAELRGDNSLENCRAICRKCHKHKTAGDVRMIRKADRQRDKSAGTFKASPRSFRKPDGMAYDWQRKRYVRASGDDEAADQIITTARPASG